jgi:hypothetical protein
VGGRRDPIKVREEEEWVEDVEGLEELRMIRKVQSSTRPAVETARSLWVPVNHDEDAQAILS